MDFGRLLAVVSLAHLATGTAGMAVALRRRHPYDFLILHGAADRMARDSVFMGTALSAPVTMLAAQGAGVGLLVHGRTAAAGRVLGVLGACMVPGYLGEALVRRRLRPSGWDSVESPLAAVGIGLATAMAVLGTICAGTSAGSRVE